MAAHEDDKYLELIPWLSSNPLELVYQLRKKELEEVMELLDHHEEMEDLPEEVKALLKSLNIEAFIE